MSRVLPEKSLETERNCALLETGHRLKETSWSLLTLSIDDNILDENF